jgi:hypothetical protein
MGPPINPVRFRGEIFCPSGSGTHGGRGGREIFCSSDSDTHGGRGGTGALFVFGVRHTEVGERGGRALGDSISTVTDAVVAEVTAWRAAMKQFAIRYEDRFMTAKA